MDIALQGNYLKEILCQKLHGEMFDTTELRHRKTCSKQGTNRTRQVKASLRGRLNLMNQPCVKIRFTIKVQNEAY